jgi:outer membrane protein
MKKLFCLCSAIFVIGFFVDRASAEEFFTPSIDGHDRLFGVIVAAVPDYEGSDDSKGAVAPLIKYKFDGSSRYFQLTANKLYFNVLNHENWEFGPMGVYRLGRDDDVDDEIVKLMKEVDDSVEVGAFIGYVKSFGNPRHRMNIHLDVTQDVSDGHDGLVAAFKGTYWRPLGKSPWDMGFGGSVSYASSEYMSSFFGVSASDSATTGLQQFKAEDGFKDIGVSLMTQYHINKSWHVAGGFQYKKLFGDAEDSPVVDVRGDSNQLMAGLGVLYTW